MDSVAYDAHQEHRPAAADDEHDDEFHAADDRVLCHAVCIRPVVVLGYLDGHRHPDPVSNHRLGSFAGDATQSAFDLWRTGDSDRQSGRIAEKTKRGNAQGAGERQEFIRAACENSCLGRIPIERKQWFNK